MILSPGPLAQPDHFWVVPHRIHRKGPQRMGGRRHVSRYDPKKDHAKRSWVMVAPWGPMLQATEAGKEQPPFLCPKELEEQVEGC